MLSVLRREIAGLVERVRPWSPERWTAGGHADVAFHLASVLAEAAQRLEQQPVLRPLPRLGDLVVPDQLAVTGDDVLRALTDHPDDAECRRLLAEVVLHRHDLDGSGWPPAHAELLGLTLEQARAACPR